jgi:DNA-binding Lrp family transcriptional regulator
MQNIDEVDRRILVELQTDARRSNKALAAAAGVSPSTMLHRIRALEDRGVVTGYHALVDRSAIGRPLEALVFIKVQPKTPDVVDEFVERVWALPETTEVTLLTGPFDILVHLCVANVRALSELVLTAIASLPHVVDEQTSIVFEHRRKQLVEPLD